MYTCIHPATCCTCVCVLGVPSSIRDVMAGIGAILEIVAVVGGGHAA